MNKSIPELVTSFIAGDQRAFEDLVRRFQKRIYSLAYHILGNHFDADEVTQETFVRVFKRRKELHNVNYFSTFLARVATNYSIDLLRKRKIQRSVAEDSATLPGNVQLDLARRVSTPAQDLESKRIMLEIQSALDELPPKQRITVILHDIEGYSKAEISAMFECPQATVRSNLHIARSKLRKILKSRPGPKE